MTTRVILAIADVTEKNAGYKSFNNSSEEENYNDY